MTARSVKSNGHIQFCGGYEYILFNGEILRADMTNVIDIRSGVRCGARFECSVYAAMRHPILKYNKKLMRQIEAGTA